MLKALAGRIKMEFFDLKISDNSNITRLLDRGITDYGLEEIYKYAIQNRGNKISPEELQTMENKFILVIEKPDDEGFRKVYVMFLNRVDKRKNAKIFWFYVGGNNPKLREGNLSNIRHILLQVKHLGPDNLRRVSSYTESLDNFYEWADVYQINLNSKTEFMNWNQDPFTKQ
jgi:hypothetical protein